MAANVETDGRGLGSPWRIAGWGAAAGLLLLPLAAMQFSDEVRWGPEDFAVAGILIGSVGIAYELAVRRAGGLAYRAGAAMALLPAFLLVWANLAVGVIGDEGNPANLMFAGVLGVALLGSMIARFRPRGMALAMAATAAAQALVGGIVLTAGLDSPIVISGFFTALWLVSAWLFGKAADPAT